MKILTVILLICSLLIGCSQSPEEQIDSVLANAIGQMDRFEFDEAAKTLKQVGEIDAASPVGYFGEGLLLERKMRYFDALAVYITILDAHPEYVPALEGQVRILKSFEQERPLVHGITAWIKADNSSVPARLARAEYLFAKREFPTGNSILDSASTLGANEGEIVWMRALSFLGAGNLDSAAVMTDRALAIKEMTPTGYGYAANYYEQAGKYDSSLMMSRLAYEASNHGWQERLNHFNRACRVQYFEEAYKTIGELEQTGQWELVKYGLLTMYYYASDQWTKASRVGVGYSQLTAGGLDLYVHEMDVSGMIGKDEIAHTHLESIQIKLAKASFPEVYNDICSYELFVRWLRYADPHALVTEIIKLPGRYNDHRPVGIARLHYLNATEQDDLFEDELEIILGRHNRQTDWLADLGKMYANSYLKRYEEATDMFETALDINSGYQPAFEGYLEMLRSTKDFNDVISIWEKYPQFANKSARNRLIKARDLIVAGQTDEGLELFKQNIIHQSGRISLFTEFADLFESMGLPEHQQTVISLMTEYNDDSPLVKVILVRNLVKDKEYQQAFDLVETVLVTSPDYLPASVEKAQLLFILGNTEDAFALFTSNAGTDPDDSQNNMYFSRAMGISKTDLRKAANIARRSMFTSQSALPQSVNLIFIYYQMDRFDLCKAEAGKAVRRFPGEPEPQFWLGMSQYKLGDDNCRTTLQKAIDFGLIGDNLKKAKQVLGRL